MAQWPFIQKMTGIQPMKIATWNVNSIKARLDHVKTWLDKAKPDILMLQEIKGVEFPTEPFEAIGYNTVFQGQKAYNGVAVLSRHAITPILTRLPGDTADEQARFIEADINGVRVLNIYAPNGNPVDTDKFPYKLAWMERLYNHVRTLREDAIPFVIGGDFNIIPEDMDCYDPAQWQGDALFRAESRAHFRALVNLGLTDALRAFHPAAALYTFWDYQAGAWPKNHGIRIDHFLCAPVIADRMKACAPDTEPRGWDKASDHTPVLLTLKAA
jgi:exodeoxyribonuclease-3